MTTTITAEAAVTGLREAIVRPLSRNDLGRLAQMHTWGQVLAEAGEPDGAASNEALRRTAEALVRLLERIILDEAANPDAGIALLPDVVRGLDATLHGQGVDAESLLVRMDAAIGDAAAAVPTPPPARSGPQPPPPTPPLPAARSSNAANPEPYVSEPLLLDLSEREHLQGFLEEAGEHMDAIESALLEVEANANEAAKLNELFRPFHTIKGIAGFLNLRDINRLTHEIETILDLGRKGQFEVTAATVDLVFAAVDTLKAQLAAIRAYLAAPSGGPCPQPEIAAIMAQLRRAAAGEPVPDTGLPQARLRDSTVCQEVGRGSDVRGAPEVPGPDAAPPAELGETLAGSGATGDPQVQRALSPEGGAGKAALDSSIRVDTAKLDALVDAVGELVIAQSMVGLSRTVRADDTLVRNVGQVSKIVRDVQEIAMAMRMVPIGQTFQKMRRLVRDVARKAGKQVELTITGEETELDKNVIQQISDPLVHMVRNAIDHGLEPPEVRRQLGKPETGVMQLHAFHQGDSIVIEVRDDGRGLDRDKLIAKGIERGLVGPDEHLTDPQVFALILQAGFSTAEKVTDISGRGVGMDVVKRNVEQLRGKIDIRAEQGRGSTFSIRLPLTLAIIDGMLVRVGCERLIIPTILIEQSLRPERKQITSVQRRGQMVQVRGQLCPLIQLGSLFNYGRPVDPCENLVVIVQAEGQKVALVVEELIGQQQVVIKSLGERFKKLLGVSGAAILGDGRVGLILEPSGVLNLHNQRGGEAFGVGTGAPVATCCPSADGHDGTAARPTTSFRVGERPGDGAEALVTTSA